MWSKQPAAHSLLAPHSDKDYAPLIVENHIFSSGDDATKLILKISVVLGGRAEVSGRQASGYTDSRQLGGVGKALWNLSGTPESHLVSGRGGG
jgi:hypothetical protein